MNTIISMRQLGHRVQLPMTFRYAGTTKRSLFVLIAITSSALSSDAIAQSFRSAPAEPYPAKIVRVVVGYPPCGPVDVIAREVTQKLSASFRRQFVVDNRPGASGMIGADLVAKAAPDGYTLLTVPITFTITPTVYPRIPYSVERDFAPVAQVAAAPLILVAHPTLPVKTVRDLIALAKARPDALNYASTGSGSGGPMSFESLKTKPT